MKNNNLPANNNNDSELFKDVDYNVNNNEVIISIPEHNYEFKIFYDDEYKIKIPNYSLPMRMTFKKFFDVTNNSRDHDLIKFLTLFGGVEHETSKQIIIEFNKKIGSDEYHKKLENLIFVYDENEKGEKTDPEPYEAPEIMQEAKEILKSGNPHNYIMDVYQNIHVGDKIAFSVIFLAIMNQNIKNSKGLQVSFNGGSSDGKSHAVKSTLKLLPSHQYIDASMSSKALFYHPDLKPGTIIYSDDTDISAELEGTLKRSMTNFQEETKHLTVDGDRRGAILLTIPKRILYLFTSVEEKGGDELQNRKIQVTIEDSRAHKERIIKSQSLTIQNGYDPYLNAPTKGMLICQAIFNIIHKEDFGVAIPFADRIIGYDLKNVRNNDKLFSLIMGFTLSKFMQREKDANGNLIATEEDFCEAATIYNKLYKNVTTNLTDAEIKMCKCIAGYGLQGVTSKDIQTELKLSQGQVSKRLQVLEAKVPNLMIDNGSDSEGFYDGSGNTSSRTKYAKRYFIYKFDECSLNESIFLADDKIDFDERIKEAEREDKKEKNDVKLKEINAKYEMRHIQPKTLNLSLEDHFEDVSESA